MAKKSSKYISTPQTTQYRGNVTIAIKDGNKTIKKLNIHNQGTYNLFYGMLIAMSGNSQDDYLPNYISLGTGVLASGDDVLLMTGLKSELTTLQNNRRSLTKNFKGPEIISVGNDKLVQVTYQGAIPYELIQTSTIKEIGLFGTVSGSTMVARVQVPDDSPISLAQGQSLIVTWTFSLANAN